MSVSTKRLKQVLNYAFTRSDEAACKFFDLTYSTISKYKRTARARGVDFKEKAEPPKILLYDLETSPIEARLWRLGKQRVGTHQVVKSWSILSWAAKWLCDDKIMGEKTSLKDATNRNDKKIVKKLYDLIDESDVIVAHNLKSFDRKKMNSRFILNGLNPPSPYQMIDTLKQARKNFKFLSNKLDYLGKILVGEQKKSTNFNLWNRCVDGDASGLKEMLEYNKQDIRLLEDVYLELRPWFTSGPNLALYYDDMKNRCPRCGSQELKLGKKGYYTATGRYKSVRCQDCGALGRERYHDLSTEERKSLLRTLAR